MFRTKSESKRANNFINNSLLSYLIYEVLFIAVLVLSLIFQKRMFTFSDIFGSLFGLKNVGLYIYYGCLGIGLAFYTALIIRTILLDDSKKLYNILNDVEKYGDIPIFIVRCIAFILFIMIFVTTPCTVVGNSMNPTFENGDKVMCFNLDRSYEIGDVVIFSSDNYRHDESFYIKRVVAKGGDTISFDPHTTTFTVNDNEVKNVSTLDYYNIITNMGLDPNCYTFTLPQDELLVFGDNREYQGSSIDSRTFGPIKKADVFGRVYLRIFPFNKFGGF